MWLSSRFLLSDRAVEERLAERGVAVSQETIRRWWKKAGPRPGDTWHLDEVPLKSNGHTHWLWRAVDQEGIVLDTPSGHGAPRRRPKPSYIAWSMGAGTRRGS